VVGNTSRKHSRFTVATGSMALYYKFQKTDMDCKMRIMPEMQELQERGSERRAPRSHATRRSPGKKSYKQCVKRLQTNVPMIQQQLNSYWKERYEPTFGANLNPRQENKTPY
jgi:hypothetical protein